MVVGRKELSCYQPYRVKQPGLLEDQHSPWFHHPGHLFEPSPDFQMVERRLADDRAEAPVRERQGLGIAFDEVLTSVDGVELRAVEVYADHQRLVHPDDISSVVRADDQTGTVRQVPQDAVHICVYL